MFRITLNIIAVLALLATILPAVLLFHGDIDIDQMKQIMLYGTIIWFAVNAIKFKSVNQS